jgi:hypothetical protein
MSKFQEIAPRIMRDLLSESKFQFGLEDAAAIAGNFAYETGGFEHMQEIKPVVRGSRGGYGWAQWTADRRRAFEAWAKRKGLSIDSYDANYSFLIRELLGPEKRAIAAVKNAQGLDAKVKAFEASYERAGVKAYSKRVSWAKKALAAYHSAALTLPSAPAPRPAPRPAHAPPPPVDIAAPLPGSWIARALMRLRIVRQPVSQQVLKTDATGPDETVRRVQQQLQALGYPEVGLADGAMGAKTQAAIRAFAADNGIASNGDITDNILATLPKARPRPVTEHRANTTARDLRAAGNEQAKAFKGLGWLGQALGLGGLLGAVNELGALDSIRQAADGAATTFATLQGTLVAIVSTLQWCVTHWWLFAMFAGVWTIYRVTVAVLNLVILFRQGVLQRASAAADGGWHGAQMRR